jgi:hypothetical protein
MLIPENAQGKLMASISPALTILAIVSSAPHIIHRDEGLN